MIGLPINPDDRQKCIRYANGDEAETEGGVDGVNTSIRTQGQLYTARTDFVVTILQTYDIILGRSWLNEHNPTINWKRNTVDLPPQYGGRICMQRTGRSTIAPIRPHDINADDDVHHLLQVRRVTTDASPYTDGDKTVHNTF